MDNISVGQRIKSIRKSKGMTTEEFAKIFSKPASKGTISKWENGRYLPNNERLVEIAALGDISVDELLYGQRNVIIKSAIDDALLEYMDSFDSEDKKKDFEENKNRYEELLASLYEEYTGYAEFVLPTDNLYLNVRNMAFKALNDEYLKGSRTNESSLLYLRSVLEETHVTVSKYEYDPLTQKAISEGKITNDNFKFVTNSLIDMKTYLTNKLDDSSISKDK